MQSCPHCGAQTPSGYAFCQQCGKKLGAPKPAAATPAKPPIDAVGPTLAAPTPQAVQSILKQGGGVHAGASKAAPATPARVPTPSPLPVTSPVWGALVSLERDGSDGERHELRGEWAEVGRERADIQFPQDRFLAPIHARLERTDGGGRIVILDQLNGVFRRVFDPVPLQDGDVLLLGREVMRFELVDDDEKQAAPLVRHGVALFGSPPREPWGRLLQLLASGGVRDIRHLFTPQVVIGREEGDIVHSDDAFLSRRHAMLSWQDGVCTLSDLDSSNGTFVRLPKNTVLQTGDQVRMGDQVFRFEFLV